jgi:hypothetical protein
MSTTFVPVNLPPEAATDPAVALPWVRETLQRVAEARGWTSAGLSAALQSADKAYAEADEADWWGADPHTFWSALGRETAGASWAGEPGAADLVLLWETAAGWTLDVQAQETAEAPITQMAGTVEESASDVATVATVAKQEAQKPSTWAAVAVVAVVVAIVVLRR